MTTSDTAEPTSSMTTTPNPVKETPSTARSTTQKHTTLRVDQLVVLTQKEPLDGWHQRRLEKLGWLYKITRMLEDRDYVEAYPVGGGNRRVTLVKHFLEPLSDAVED